MPEQGRGTLIIYEWPSQDGLDKVEGIFSFKIILLQTKVLLTPSWAAIRNRPISDFRPALFKKAKVLVLLWLLLLLFSDERNFDVLRKKGPTSWKIAETSIKSNFCFIRLGFTIVGVSNIVRFWRCVYCRFFFTFQLFRFGRVRLSKSTLSFVNDCFAFYQNNHFLIIVIVWAINAIY